MLFQLSRAVFICSDRRPSARHRDQADPRPTDDAHERPRTSSTWSPGEAMLADRSNLPLDWLTIEDDGEAFAALRDVAGGGQATALFAASVARTVKGQLAFEPQACPELEATVARLDIDFAGQVRPSADMLWSRINKGRILDIAREILGTGMGLGAGQDQEGRDRQGDGRGLRGRQPSARESRPTPTRPRSPGRRPGSRRSTRAAHGVADAGAETATPAEAPDSAADLEPSPEPQGTSTAQQTEPESARRPRRSAEARLRESRASRPPRWPNPIPRPSPPTATGTAPPRPRVTRPIPRPAMTAKPPKPKARTPRLPARGRPTEIAEPCRQGQRLRSRRRPRHPRVPAPRLNRPPAQKRPAQHTAGRGAFVFSVPSWRPCMTHTVNPPAATIRARVHGSALKRVTRFFASTLYEIFTETLQSARRAGATRVRVTVATAIGQPDDGAPEPSETPPDRDCHRRRRRYRGARGPADLRRERLERGPGSPGGRRRHGDPEPRAPRLPDRLAAAHAARPCRAWLVRGPLSRNISRGTATPRSGTTTTAPYPSGTAVQFQATVSADMIHTAIASAARHYPLPVTFEGETLERQSFPRRRRPRRGLERPRLRRLPGSPEPRLPRARPQLLRADRARPPAHGRDRSPRHLVRPRRRRGLPGLGTATARAPGSRGERVSGRHARGRALGGLPRHGRRFRPASRLCRLEHGRATPGSSLRRRRRSSVPGGPPSPT